MMEFEIIGFIGTNTPDGRTKKSQATIFQPSIPNPMFNGKDEPSRYHTERLSPKNLPLAAKLESTACGPAGEFADHDQCVKMISQPW